MHNTTTMKIYVDFINSCYYYSATSVKKSGDKVWNFDLQSCLLTRLGGWHSCTLRRRYWTASIPALV